MRLIIPKTKNVKTILRLHYYIIIVIIMKLVNFYIYLLNSLNPICILLFLI